MFTIGRLDIGIRIRGAGTPPVPAAPVSTSAPAITGSPLVGASLSCSTGGWTGFPAPTFTYQWIWADTSANISGATSSTYTPVSGDLGHTLKCAVTATNSQGNATANSNTTAAVAALPVNTVAPAVTGSTNVGQTLSTTNGTWSNTPTSYAYQWKWADTGANISGATASTYVLVTGDVGHTIKCTVTATNGAGSASADSNTTAAVTAGITPAFQADFTALSALPAGISFSRASSAMVFDSTGKSTYAPNNIILQSNNFSNAAWNTITATLASGISDPDGGTNASTLTATGASAFLYQQVGVDGNYVNSIWIRRRTGTGTISLRTPDNVTTTPISVTGSWQRLFVNGPAAGGPSVTFAIIIATSGDAVDIYQAQGERVTYETSPRTYNQTTSAAYYGPRFDYAWNGSAWVAVGLLIEEQRTNLFLGSNDFSNAAQVFDNASRTAGATTSPDSTTNAIKLVEATGTSEHRTYQPCTTGNGTTGILACFAKKAERNWIGIRNDSAGMVANFNLNTGVVGTSANCTPLIINCGNGWYLCIIIGTLADYCIINIGDADTGTGSGHAYTGDGTSGVYLYGGTIQQGGVWTSYIPTTTAAATRSADIVQLTGAALALMQGSAFTAIIETSNVLFGSAIFEGNGNNGFIAASWDTHTAQSYNGISSLLAPFPSGFWSDIQRCAYAGDAVGRSFVASGGTLSTDTGPFEGSTPTFIAIGNNSSSGQIDGYVRSLAIYNTRLSDATLQAKSVVGAAF